MPTAPPVFRKADRKTFGHRKGTTTERGYGWKHQQARAKLLRREPLCRMCKAKAVTTEATIADHIVNLASGGSQSEDNLQPLCGPCHVEKTAQEAQNGRGDR